MCSVLSNRFSIETVLQTLKAQNYYLMHTQPKKVHKCIYVAHTNISCFRYPEQKCKLLKNLYVVTFISRLLILHLQATCHLWTVCVKLLTWIEQHFFQQGIFCSQSDVSRQLLWIFEKSCFLKQAHDFIIVSRPTFGIEMWCKISRLIKNLSFVGPFYAHTIAFAAPEYCRTFSQRPKKSCEICR